MNQDRFSFKKNNGFVIENDINQFRLGMYIRFSCKSRNLSFEKNMDKVFYCFNFLDRVLLQQYFSKSFFHFCPLPLLFSLRISLVRRKPSPDLWGGIVYLPTTLAQSALVGGENETFVPSYLYSSKEILRNLISMYLYILLF